MSAKVDHGQPSLLEPDTDDLAGVDDCAAEYGGPKQQFGLADFDDSAPLRPINWNLLGR